LLILPIKSFDCTVRNSLSTIRVTHVRLHLLDGLRATAPLLACQIELYGVLLDEIPGITPVLPEISNTGA